MRQLVPALFSLNLYWREEWVLPLEASKPISSGITTTTPWTILKRRVSLCCRRCSSRARRCNSFRSCVALHCWRGERYWHHLVSGFWTCSVAFFFCAAKCVCVGGWVGGWVGGGADCCSIFETKVDEADIYAVFLSSGGHSLRFHFRNPSF